MGGFASVITRVGQLGISDCKSGMCLAPGLCHHTHIPVTPIIYHTVVVIPKDVLWRLWTLRHNTKEIITLPFYHPISHPNQMEPSIFSFFMNTEPLQNATLYCQPKIIPNRLHLICYVHVYHTAIQPVS